MVGQNLYLISEIVKSNRATGVEWFKMDGHLIAMSLLSNDCKMMTLLLAETEAGWKNYFDQKLNPVYFCLFQLGSERDRFWAKRVEIRLKRIFLCS